MESSEKQPEYLYTRVRFDTPIVDHILMLDGRPGKLHEDGSFELIFRKFCYSRQDAEQLALVMRVVANQMQELAADLNNFVDNYVFPWERDLTEEAETA